MRVLEEERISDHWPVQLLLPCEKPEEPEAERKYHVQSITDEQWDEMDWRLQAELERLEPRVVQHIEHRNATRLYACFERILGAPSSPFHRVSTDGTASEPMATFLTRSAAHPEIGQLRGAVGSDDRPIVARLLKCISRDGRRTFLGG